MLSAGSSWCVFTLTVETLLKRASTCSCLGSPCFIYLWYKVNKCQGLLEADCFYVFFCLFDAVYCLFFFSFDHCEWEACHPFVDLPFSSFACLAPWPVILTVYGSAFIWSLFMLVHWVAYTLQVRLCLKSTWYKLQGKKLNMDENLTGTRSSVMSVSGTSSWQFFIYNVLKHSLSNICDMCFCLFVLSSLYYDVYPILAIFIFIFYYLWNASTPKRGLRNGLRIFRVDTVQGAVTTGPSPHAYVH